MCNIFMLGKLKYATEYIQGIVYIFMERASSLIHIPVMFLDPFLWISFMLDL